MINSYLVGLIFCTLPLLMALFVLKHNPRRIQNILFFNIGLSASIFTVFIFLSYLYPERPGLTTIFNRFSVAFTLSTAGSLFFFSLVFPGERIRKKALTGIFVYMVIIIIGVLAVGTDWFVKTMEVRITDKGLRMFRETGMMYKKLYLPFFGLFILGSAISFINQYKKSDTRVEKKQVLYAAVATIGGGLITTVTCMLLPMAGINQLYIFGPPVAVPFFIFIMGYTIISLKAMDIDQLVSKTILWILSLTLMALPIAVFTSILLSNAGKFNVGTGTAFMMLGISLIFLYLKYLQPYIDEKLQKKVHDYRKIIEDFNDHMSKLKSLDDLVELILSTIEGVLYPSNYTMLIERIVPGEYFVLKSKNYDGSRSVKLSRSQVNLLLSHGEILEKEQMIVNPDINETLRKSALLYCGFFKCDLVIPIIFENRLIGMINIGPKKERFYKRMEILFLEKMITGINISFSNSMLLKQIEKLKDSYARFVPKEMLGFLGQESIIDVSLGDNVEHEMSILFSDIRAFTPLSEGMTPTETFNFLNSYLNRVSPVIRKYNGFIDKYIGDAVMALFPQSVDDAIEAAIDMHLVVALNNKARIERGYIPIKIGIGIHTGTLMLGTIGESSRMDCTVISDAVNLASRIEGLTKIYGSKIIISEEALSKIKETSRYNYRYLGNVQVKGKIKSVRIYDVFDGDDKHEIEIKNKTKITFEMGINSYFNKDFETAMDCFMKSREDNLEDPALEFYIEKLTQHRIAGIPDDWSGSEIMVSKF